jgi:hypothetical protein
MKKKGTGLAGRFRQALKQREVIRLTDAQEKQRRLDEDIRARVELFDTLVAFAREVGFVTAGRDKKGVTLRLGERVVRFLPIEDSGDVKVEVDAAPKDERRLYREPELKDRWVMLRRLGRRDDRIPFFDRGLEELMVRGLDMPRPTDWVDDDQGA